MLRPLPQGDIHNAKTALRRVYKSFPAPRFPENGGCPSPSRDPGRQGDIHDAHVGGSTMPLLPKPLKAADSLGSQRCPSSTTHTANQLERAQLP